MVGHPSLRCSWPRRWLARWWVATEVQSWWSEVPAAWHLVHLIRGSSGLWFCRYIAYFHDTEPGGADCPSGRDCKVVRPCGQPACCVESVTVPPWVLCSCGVSTSGCCQVLKLRRAPCFARFVLELLCKFQVVGCGLRYVCMVVIVPWSEDLVVGVVCVSRQLPTLIL